VGHDVGILAPVVAMFVLTAVVWAYMYVLRIGYMRRERIHPQSVRSPRRKGELIPEEVNYPADNLANLTELPVIFYALCLVLSVAGLADGLDVAAAWVYVALRALHSAVQCTVNRVMLRFTVYVASSLILWLMVARTAVRLFASG
jgi:hypothetical protein